MERLEIRLLGGFELRRDGRTLDPLPLRAARSLFAFLVLNRERVLTRDLLAGTFWPDFDETRARRRLSQALWQAQKALGEEDGQRYIIGTPDTIRFNAEADVWIDVDEFVGSLDEAADASSSDEVAALRRAVDMYQGDLLAGFYDDWLFHDQDRIRTRFLGALERLADLAIAKGDYETAFQHARRLAQEDEFDEEAHRRVMRVAVLLGRHNEAIKQYEECTRILAEELGAEPSAETVELYEKTLADRDSGTRAVPSHEDSPLFGDVAGSPFIGRESERARLAQRLDDALEGKGRIVLVEGEAGVGKTRLLREVAEDAQWRGMDVVWGRSAPSGGRPFGPIGDALRNGLSELRVRQLQNKLDDVRLATLGDLLGSNDPAGSADSIGADDQLRMYEAIGAAFVAMAATVPVLVVLEDVHWADEDSVTALTQIMKRVSDQRIVIAVTYRHAEARERSEVWGFLRTIDQLEHAERVSLAAMTPAQTEELIRTSLSRTEVSPTFSDRVHQESGGIPLFVLETLRARYERGMLGDADSPAEAGPRARDRIPVAPVVRSMMRNRLDGLSPETRSTLELLSAHPADLLVSEVVHASELHESAVIGALDELLGRRLIETVGAGFGVSHDVLRRVTYEPLELSTRLDAHRRIAAAVRDTRPHEYEVLAHHFEAARMHESALEALENAANRAVGLNALDAAARHFAKALELAKSVDIPHNRSLRLAIRYERVLDVLGRRVDQEALLHDMERLASPGDRALVLRRQAWWLAHMSRVDEAKQKADEALELAQETSAQDEVVATLTALGMILFYVGRPADAVPFLERAASGSAEGSPEEADAHSALGKSLIDLQRFDEAAAHLAISLARYRSLGNARGEAEVHGTLGTMRLERGEFQTATENLTRAIEISGDVGYRQGEAFYRMNLAIVLAMTHRLQDAVDAFEECERAYLAIGSDRGRAMALSNLAWLLHSTLGDDSRARSLAREARDLFDAIANPRGAAHCQSLLASVAGREGDVSLAEQLFADALSSAESADDGWLTAQILREMAALDLESGALEQGLDRATRAEQLSRELGLDDLVVGILALRARLALRADRLEDAKLWSREAVASATPDVELAHVAFLAAGEVQAAVGEPNALESVVTASHMVDASLASFDAATRKRAWSAVPEYRSIGLLRDRLETRSVSVRLPSEHAPRGRRLTSDDYVSVDWTIHLPSDQEVDGPVDRRRVQLVRLSAEAAEQGASPTVNDLASAVGASAATVRRDLAELRAAGVTVRTRGWMADPAR